MSWLIKSVLWILIIFLVIAFFPKPCDFDSGGTKNTCIGFDLSKDSVSKSGKSFGWCSGYCKSESVRDDGFVDAKEVGETGDINNINGVGGIEKIPNQINSFSKSFEIVIPLLLVIVIMVAVVAAIQSLVRNAGG